ncbi:CotH protein [Pseudobutyrivibrio sp. UC1225]|uniref:CotH kinase family protein n=1 Tax=Pseudobutyrivibrio sp. UC1225 TaxID=1798185 RepID=UPI0008E9DA49|nr:CotH kinase family protein [Pseudobutyrivibrio sp. UC1225]SFO20921.1 CotH protein [Pseudobutyrivibrio sp. UC1225]
MILNRKQVSIFVVIISLLVLSGGLYFYTHGKTTRQFDDLYISDKKLDSMLHSYTLSQSPLSTSIVMNGQQLIYDYNDNIFYYSIVPEDGEFPTITVFNDGSTGKKINVFAHGAKLSAETISSNTPIDIILTDGDSMSVSSLACTTLPVMNISVSAETVNELGLDETYAISDYAPCEMYLYDNESDFEGASRVTTSSAKIHMRGGTTIGAPQHSYRLSLLKKADDFDKKNKANLLRLREDDDWILFSAYSDYEKIRTPFCMNLWQDIAAGNNEWQVPNSNQYKYIELFINNRYHGLYALTYPMDKKVFSIKDGESLFKKKDWSGTEFSQDLEYFEYEGGGGFYYLPGYSVEYGSSDDYEPLHELYHTMAYSEDVSEIRSTCDIDNAIDLWLFYKLTQAVDNVYANQVKNLFSCVKHSETGMAGYKVLFAPWDMDQTFGNRFVDGQGSHGISSYFNAPDWDLPMEWSPVYFLMAKGDPDIVAQVKSRYSSLRATQWSDEEMSALIDDYESTIYDSGAFKRTMNRWPDGNYYEEAIGLSDFKTFVLERLKCMDSYIDSLQ